MAKLEEVFGRTNEEGNVDILFKDTGERATRLYVDNVQPVGSFLSTRYEHNPGIILTKDQAEDLGIEIE